MKEAMRTTGAVVAVHREGSRKLKKRSIPRCSICTRGIWLRPVHLTEPAGVPEPRLSWTLCKRCYKALAEEMRRSPVQSSLRLRIAMGLVASERWPQAYSTRVRTYIDDRKWIVFIAVGFIVAMILHLALIVAIASIH